MDSETWFEIEYSHRGENDWYQSGMGTFDALESAREKIRNRQDEGFDYRVVKVIHTREAL
jgi:hypothetical protein